MHQAIPYITRWRRPWLCGCHWQYATSEPRWWFHDLQKLSGELQKRRRPFSSFSPDLNSETILQISSIISIFLGGSAGGDIPNFLLEFECSQTSLLQHYLETATFDVEFPQQCLERVALVECAWSQSFGKPQKGRLFCSILKKTRLIKIDLGTWRQRVTLPIMQGFPT